ncbi:hypothetical protein OPW19_18930 [Vibrio europaeus]|uniref:hypothetical protein n=1 Tax=Vibrio europaeus TaxID=300876 RepID=UPI00233F679A|nr:hypothetical protein [Vibrio europaeus]MDC5821888.1 hypothetical protein [Vibrio europaeus]
MLDSPYAFQPIDDKTIIMPSVKIQDLTNNDNNYWRIDWFGNLSYFDHTGNRRSQPLVDIYLSRLHSAPWKTDFNYKSATAYKQQRKVTFPVGYLAKLQIGDVWRQGSYVMTPEYSVISTGATHISSQETITCRANHKKADGYHLIPFDRHPYHSKATNVFCEVVKLSNGTQLVFPHWVLLQTYFTSCPFLFTQLFQFGVQLDTLYDKDKSQLDGGLGRIHLKKWTYDSGASDIARIAWDPHARHAYTMVSNYLAICSSNRWTTTPKTKFPFFDLTNLTVRGKHLPCSKGEPSFIVFEILDCTADYPFETLLLDRDNPGSIGRKKHTSKPSSAAQNHSPLKVPRADNRLDLLPDHEPNSEFDNLSIAARPRALLSGLSGKLISKIQHEAPDPSTSGVSTISKNVDTGNSGTGWSNGEGAPIRFIRSTTEQLRKSAFIFNYPICRLSIFRRVIEHLARKKCVKSTKFIPVNANLGNIEGDYSFFPDTFTTSGRKRKWRYIGYVKGSESTNNRLRKALVAEILTEDTYLYIIEIERRVAPCEGSGWVELDDAAMLLIYSSKSKTPLQEHSLKALLEQCAKQSGIWFRRDQDRLIDSYLAKPIKHPEKQTISSPEKHDRDMIRNIEQNTGINFEQ